MHRFGAEPADMREMNSDDIFLMRLRLLIVMAYAYLEGYPIGLYRKSSLIENAHHVANGVVDWGRIVNFRSFHEVGEVSLDHLFYQRVKLLSVMIKGIAEGNPMGHFRDRALRINADYISEAIKFNRKNVDIEFLKVAWGDAIINNVKIAVVDDDDPHRGFVVNALMYCVNREIMSFDSAYSAWVYIEGTESADIIVADINMPEMDGFDLISKVKDKYPNKVCILMSGNPANEKMAMDYGADAFLAKPFTVNDLFSIVQTFVVGDNCFVIYDRTLNSFRIKPKIL